MIESTVFQQAHASSHPIDADPFLFALVQCPFGSRRSSQFSSCSLFHFFYLFFLFCLFLSAPSSGCRYGHPSGLAKSSDDFAPQIVIMKNWGIYSIVQEQGQEAYITSSWMIQLNEKDTVYINNYVGTLYTDRFYPMNFSGQLIMREE